MLDSTGDTHLLVYATSSAPLGPFVYRGPLLQPVWGWTTHASVVEWEGLSYLVHHDSSCSLGETARRCTKVAPLRYDGSGAILPVAKGVPLGTSGATISSVRPAKDVTTNNVTTKDVTTCQR